MRRPATALNATLDAIDEIAIGEYASFRGHLVGAEDERAAVPADRLLDRDMRTAIETRFARRFEAFDARALHSIWMKWYLNRFLPPVLLADILLHRPLPVALETTCFIIDPDTRVAAVRLDDAGEHTDSADSFDRFSSLIFSHFEPLIEMWAARTDVTRRVFWSNVGNTFEAMLRKIESVSGPSERLAEAQRLLEEPIWGRIINPLFDAVYYVREGGERLRRRRICCIQYLLPDRRFCKACPVEEARTVPAIGPEPH